MISFSFKLIFPFPMRLGASTWTTNGCFMQEVGKKIVHLGMHEISAPYQLSADICECYAM